MSNFRKLFTSLDRGITGQYDQFGLKCLNDIKIDGKNHLTFFSETLNGITPIQKYNWYEFEIDIEFISNDLKYYTALLFLLKPFINFPLREGKTYFQTLEDKRYMSYASLLYQILYNFWDRIGDFLFCHLETGLKERAVYFSTVIQNLPDECASSSNFKTLKKVYDEHLVDLFRDRKTIVHYVQISARMYSHTFLHSEDRNYLEDLEAEKEGYPEYFRNHIECALKGFEHSVKLVGEFGLRNDSEDTS